ncbi:uncharacterized protein ASPGLDRAFT_139214 [Aspergillus glaucus CBS 516.65]|uniref:Rhodopsin domain-containing protein n=1 Tax=Aspergillus glaucus CBS 516.65 TaxID=1160497 RepID=A0A1L9VYR9_ASPGL|nr:hypothetical protein ASPGLDRAFT_139214 [Aspergillus glaucus CBS 516.65]OJJ89061.1 hypothetical protein ASPGLDRAFT_139214 [Aspergillus glaucus CBS 516.65]
MAYNVASELFAEWAIGLVIIAIRLYARWKVGGEKFYWDDLCLGSVTVFWTFHTVFLYLCTDVYGSNIGLTDKTALEVPDDQVPVLREGSIDAFVAWLSYIFMAWSFKGVLIFLYNKMTMGLWQHRLSVIASIFCVCTFFASLFFHLFICYPVHKTWQIKPYPGDNCTVRPLNYIVIETLSIVTDIVIMCVPIPLILAARIRATQKLMLCCLFSSGIFVMVAAFLRAYYSVKNISSLSIALGWASREALVSVITVSAPGLKPLITRSRWFQSYGSSGGATGTAGTATIGGSNKRLDTTCSRNKSRGWRESIEPHPIEMGSSLGFKKGRRDSEAESQEHIIGEEDSGKGQGKNGGILVTTDLTFSEDIEQEGQK